MRGVIAVAVCAMAGAFLLGTAPPPVREGGPVAPAVLPGARAAVRGPGAGPPAGIRLEDAVAGRPGHAVPAGSDPDTTVTFTVSTGTLSITVPSAANLGTGTDGSNIIGSLGIVSVADDRGLLSASWTVTASSTSFTTGSGTGPETIPASNALYIPGRVTPVGTITVTPTTITLSGTPQTVVAGTAGVGDNDASWNPTISVAIPSVAVGGIYTGTLTHSVS